MAEVVEKGLISDVERLVQKTARVVKDATDEPFILDPGMTKLMPLEQFQKAPYRIREQMKFHEVTSFLEYVEKFKTKDTILVQASDDIVAYLDFHGSKEPSWNTHRAILTCEYDDLFSEWLKLNGRYISQLEFAEFLEMNTLGVVSPPAAELIEISQTLVANSTVNFRSGVRTTNGDTQLQYDKNTTATAGERGEMSIPEIITVNLPIFEGCKPSTIRMRLFWRISDADKKLSFKVQIMEKVKLLEDARKLMRDQIESESDMKILR